MTLGGPTGTAARDATPRRASGERTDFFISHAGRDAAWAEWMAWQSQQAGYTVELDVWDWTPGEDFVTRMQQALERAGRPRRAAPETLRFGPRPVIATRTPVSTTVQASDSATVLPHLG